MKEKNKKTVAMIVLILLSIIIYLSWHQLKMVYNKDIIEKDKQIHGLQQELLELKTQQVESQNSEVSINNNNDFSSFMLVEFQDINGQYQINENIALYSLPSQKSTLLVHSSISNPIEVIAVVQNSEKEKWALVYIFDFDYLSLPSYGYIEVEKYTFIKNSDASSIQYRSYEALPGVYMGDTLDSLILQLGEKYIKVDDHGDTFYHFYSKVSELDDEYSVDTISGTEIEMYNLNKGIDLYISPLTKQLHSLFIYSSEFPLATGYKVGDNAEEVMSFYESKYLLLNDQNEEIEHPIAFQLSEDYVILFYIRDEVIDKISILDKNSI